MDKDISSKNLIKSTFFSSKFTLKITDISSCVCENYSNYEKVEVAIFR